jgi:NADH-quinone oxidoreductase subunit E
MEILMGHHYILQNSNQVISFDGFAGHPGELITLLQLLQDREGYISKEGIRQIASFLKLSENQIFGVASFYSQFRFDKPGKNKVRVCQGTACHVQGGNQLSQEVRNTLGVSPGETTADQQYEFHEVACLGCCAQASVVEINGKIYGKMTPEQLHKVLSDHERL